MAEMNTKKKVYMGIDFAQTNAMVSYLMDGMEEPQTVSTIVGGQSYKMPYDFTLDQVKEDFLKLKEHPDAEVEVFPKWLTLFHKISQMGQRINTEKYDIYLGITVDVLDQDTLDLFDHTLDKLGFDRERVKYMEHSESYFYYTFHQPTTIWQNQVALFEFQGDEMNCMLLNRNTKSVPQQVSIQKFNWVFHDMAEAPDWKKDLFVSVCMQEVFQTHLVSGIYLIGDEFQIEWMKDTKRTIGASRRTFMGQNLFTKGACYAVALRGNVQWPYVFQADYKVLSSLRIKVMNDGQESMLPLTVEGDNWFDCKVSYDFMLRGSAQIDLYQYKSPDKEPKVQFLKLTNMPSRSDKTIRLSLHANAVSKDICRIEIKDMGFGEFYGSSGRNWKFDIKL